MAWTSRACRERASRVADPRCPAQGGRGTRARLGAEPALPAGGARPRRKCRRSPGCVRTGCGSRSASPSGCPAAAAWVMVGRDAAPPGAAATRAAAQPSASTTPPVAPTRPASRRLRPPLHPPPPPPSARRAGRRGAGALAAAGRAQGGAPRGEGRRAGAGDRQRAPGRGAGLLARSTAARHPRGVASVRDWRVDVFAESRRPLADRQWPAVPREGPPDAGSRCWRRSS